MAAGVQCPQSGLRQKEGAKRRLQAPAALAEPAAPSKEGSASARRLAGPSGRANECSPPGLPAGCWGEPYEATHLPKRGVLRDLHSLPLLRTAPQSYR